jgi:hypothetical protein
MQRPGPLARFVLWVIAWLPITFAVWYVAAPLLMWPTTWVVRAVVAPAFPDLVASVAQSRAIIVFASTLHPGTAGALAGAIDVEVNALVYALGMPLFAALTLAARQPRRARTLAIGYAVSVPVVAWGVIAEFLQHVAIASGPVLAAQTGFSAPQREMIAFAYQLGTLILPTVVPAVLWVVTHREFLLAMRASQR